MKNQLLVIFFHTEKNQQVNKKYLKKVSSMFGGLSFMLSLSISNSAFFMSTAFPDVGIGYSLIILWACNTQFVVLCYFFNKVQAEYSSEKTYLEIVLDILGPKFNYITKSTFFLFLALQCVGDWLLSKFSNI